MQESPECVTPIRSSDPVKTVTLDLETSGLDPFKDKIYLNGYRINRRGVVKCVRPDIVDGELNGYLSDPNVTLSGHNIKFDALFLANAGYSVLCQLEDTKVLACLCWPGEESYSLKDLVGSKFGRKPTKLGDLLFKPLKRELVHLDEFQDQYFLMDEKWARRDLISDYHKEDILNVDRLRSILVAPKWFYEVEKPLTRLLFEAELYGCPIDICHLKLVQLQYEEKVKEVEATFESGFNPRSSEQVAEALTRRGIDLATIAKKTKDGKWSVDKQLLKRLSWKGEALAKSLLEYRRIEKILSTYIRPFIERSETNGNRLHGSFNQAGSQDIYGDGGTSTATGRLSSSNPNLQNIPARTKEGKQVRKAFIPTPGQHLANADLKQIEPRFVGHYSQSPKLIKAYKEGLDTHGLFANDIFLGSIPSATVVEAHSRSITATERFIGKTSWLATVYGCSPKKLLLICETFSDTPLEIDITPFSNDFYNLPKRAKYGISQEKLVKEYGTEEEARQIFAKWQFFKNVQDKFIKANPEIWGWRNEHIERTRHLGYVRTIGGRVIRITGLDSSNKWDVIEAERKAVNYLIQGSAADTMKLILVNLAKDPRFKGRLLTTVHDEILAEVPAVDQLQVIKNVMENSVKLLNVPIEADAKIIANWSEK